jgi:hypothetical protein
MWICELGFMLKDVDIGSVFYEVRIFSKKITLNATVKQFFLCECIL